MAMRAGSVCAALVVSMFVLLASAGPIAHAAAPPAPSAASAEEQLAQRYAPIVYLKQQSGECGGGGEPYAPMPVEGVLGNPRVTLRDRKGNVVAKAPTARDLFDRGEGYYIDLPGNPRDPGCTYEKDFRAIASTLPDVVYARVASEPGKRGVVLQYWLYYYFNDWNNKHESDWEMVQLFFDVGSAEEALAMHPDHTAYSQHSRAERAEWDSAKLRREGDHPVVYVAQGSHSNQYAPDRFLGRAEQGAGFGCDDATPPSRRVVPEVRLIPGQVSGPGDPYAWTAYTGSWGQRESGEFDGPTGPNTTTQWSRPVTWEATRLRDTSVKVPGGRTAGMRPSDVFCSFVSYASMRLLPVVQAAPWLIPLIGVAILGMVFVTLFNTTFAPSPEPLRRRRAAGQILRTALMLYRTHARLMLGIAIAFIPAGLIASELQSLTFGFAPIRALLDVVVITRAGEAAIGLALGTSVFGVAYFFVVPGVIAALGAIERGERVTPLEAYAAAWSRAWDLLRARMLAAAIVTVLAVTIVGIPWAIKRAVSWAFIEQAVLLDGESWRGALLASEAAARGHWRRTAVIGGILLAFGLVASLVIVAPILLVATNVPLSTVNTMASVIYIALVPFVALALTLLYFDIQSRRQQGDPGAVRVR